ncbi:sulfotransferase domain-containing protein [Streptomyces sp. NEAU-sy36]|uniref:sulfotransferase domain-containing protein n=1 Tax=unclassified Streptomyces TaxID=2593676 RepID=UPI0015D5D1DD|nr:MULTISPECIES: sulfotransferase domain-containing protein [unclassified Streptomyces]QLJ03413.1 sulfotransferase domain-containing protein [Streptomyces sp. NEAU-sy36]
MSEKIYYLLHGIQDRYNALYQDNIEKLGPQDIAVASIGGSGQSLLGNILLELGLNYADPYIDSLHTDGTSSPVPAYAEYRSRLAATDRSSWNDQEHSRKRWPRFVKTHLAPDFLAPRPLLGAWILIRDPRDSLYSWHKFRTNFAKDPLDILAGTFEQWLEKPGPAGVSRLDDWSSFYDAWDHARGRFQRSTVTTFEDLKNDPVPALCKSLEDLEVDVKESDLVRAIERSSFDTMRAHEEQRSRAKGDTSATNTRIMRSGTPNEWQGWMTPGLQQKFGTGKIAEVARRFGYETTAA